MPYSFETITCVTLEPRSTLAHPTTPPEIVKLDSPAAAVMTNFKVVHPITTRPEVAIDVALKKMKTSGVRLLFVMNDATKSSASSPRRTSWSERPIQIATNADAAPRLRCRR
jgi:hypothetical protein